MLMNIHRGDCQWFGQQTVTSILFGCTYGGRRGGGHNVGVREMNNIMLSKCRQFSVSLLNCQCECIMENLFSVFYFICKPFLHLTSSILVLMGCTKDRLFLCIHYLIHLSILDRRHLRPIVSSHPFSYFHLARHGGTLYILKVISQYCPYQLAPRHFHQNQQIRSYRGQVYTF